MSKIWLWVRIVYAAIRRKIRPSKITGVDPAVSESDTPGIVVIGVSLSEKDWADFRDKYMALNRDRIRNFKAMPYVWRINDEDWKNIRRN